MIGGVRHDPEDRGGSMTGRRARSRGPLVAACVLITSAAGCGEETPLVPVIDENVLLVTQPPGFTVFFASEYRGDVVIDAEGCFRLDLAPPNDATVIWPPGTSLWARGNQLELQDPRGRRIVAIGSPYRFVGGFVVGLDEVADLDAVGRDETRARCPGPYWLLRAGTARRITR